MHHQLVLCLSVFSRRGDSERVVDGFGLRVPCTHRGRSLVSSVSDSGAGATCLPGGDRGSLHPIPPPPRPPAFTLMLGDRVLARGGTVCRRWRKQVTTSNDNSPLERREGEGRGGGGRRRRSGGVSNTTWSL